MNNRKLYRLVAVAAAMITPTTVLALDKKPTNEAILAEVAMGYSRISMPARLDSVVTVPSYTYSAQSSHGSSYLAGSYSTTLAEEGVVQGDAAGSLKNTDMEVMLGYRSSSNMNWYAGYKKGETAVDYIGRDDAAARIGSESFNKSGYFAGLGYSMNMGALGVLTLSVEYNKLDTDNRFISLAATCEGDACTDTDGDTTAGDTTTEDTTTEDTVTDTAVESTTGNFSDLVGDYEGKADGLNYGVSWQIPLAKSLAFNTTFKIRNYDETIESEGVVYSASQKQSIFNVGVLWAF